MTLRAVAILMVCLAQHAHASQITFLEGQISEGALYMPGAGGNDIVFTDFPVPYTAEFHFQPAGALALFRFTLPVSGQPATQTIEENLFPGVLTGDRLALDVDYESPQQAFMTFFDLSLDKTTGQGYWNWSDMCLVCDRIVDPYSKATITSFRDVLSGDFEEDGDVDSGDLAAWKLGLGIADTAAHRQGDADGDLDVDGSDFLIWQQQLGSALPAAAAIPEAGAGALAWLAIGGCVLVGRRSRWKPRAAFHLLGVVAQQHPRVIGFS